MSVELAALISELRKELSAAMQAGQDEDLRFELGTVELELTVMVGKAAGPNAKVKFWVVELGADAKLSSQSTQRIKLRLDPRHARMPDKRPVISGSVSPDKAER